MSRNRKHYQPHSAPKRTPMRGEIWLVVDRDRKHDTNKEDVNAFGDSVQGGTRYCIVVSNNTGNYHSPVVEVVYVTTKLKNDLPTHFDVMSTPKPSTVLCEQVMTVSKKDLRQYYGTLTSDEIKELNKCLRISLGL